MKGYKETTPQVVSSHLEVIIKEPESTHALEPFEIVLVHGSCHTAECWHHFQEAFAQAGYRSLAINLRGHGNSYGREALLRTRLQDYVSDVEQVVIEKVSRPFVLVGHSVGGYVVQSYLYQADLPRPAGAVLLASPTITQVQRVRPDLKSVLPYSGLFLRMAITGNARALYPTPKETRRWFFTPDTPQEIVDDCFRHLQDDSIRASFDSSRLPSPEKQGRPPGETPMLLLGADRDTFFPPSSIQASASAYNADAMIFLNRGHDLMLDQGWKEVADYMVQWMKSHLLPALR